ncbi:MAG: beta-ketoacyl-[acyl-carrier-protein] synthase family protein [Candidatus Omnitrophota bacterium]
MIKNSKNNNQRVVITGLGVVSSIGIGWQEFWKNLLAGKSGISKITSFDTSQYDRHYGGEIKNFDPTQFISKRRFFKMGRASQLAVAAAKLALEDAKLDKKTITGKRVGVVAGTTMGEPQILENLYYKSALEKKFVADSISALTYSPNFITVSVAKEFGLNSCNLLFGNACSAGNYALGYAFDLIKAGKVDVIVAGGVDAFSAIAFTGFNRLLVMAPEKCQPFDKNRKGMLLAEGCGMLILESLDSALKRKAMIYAEVLGYGLSCDAVSMTTSDHEQIIKATKKALRNSTINPIEIDYISAHGTGTIENDRAECKAFKAIFGERLKDIPVSSIKSMLGHPMGASAVIEAIACCLAIKDQKVPPTINFETKDPDCDIDCVPNKFRACKIKTVLNNSQAFGGNNASIILRTVFR